MRIRAFLSHKRENARAVARLKEALKMYGAGGWKDTDDLRLGASTEEAIRRAIFEETGGFIWWGTHKALKSKVINGLEIPAALERAAQESRYPLVPVFVDIRPSAASEELNQRIGKRRTSKFMDRNGLPRVRRERLDDLGDRVARRYVQDAVGALGGEEVAVAFRALSEPSGEHDITFDWRAVIDERSRRIEAGSPSLLLRALANARGALQAREVSPKLSLDLDLPLPLAFLVGFEWRVTSRLRLRIKQRTGSTFSWVEHAGTLGEAPTPVARPLNGDGPAVVAVSCKDSLNKISLVYAEEVGASEVIQLHVPGLLDPDGMRALARATAKQLRTLNDRGLDKHLLIRGPTALAVMSGAESNATGPVVLPFWDGSRYVSSLMVGR